MHKKAVDSSFILIDLKNVLKYLNTRLWRKTLLFIIIALWKAKPWVLACFACPNRWKSLAILNSRSCYKPEKLKHKRHILNAGICANLRQWSRKSSNNVFWMQFQQTFLSNSFIQNHLSQQIFHSRICEKDK